MAKSEQTSVAEPSSHSLACGCNNEGVWDEKLGTVGAPLEARRNGENLCRVFPFLRWFEK